ncbi:2-phospho-L-lactate guanylyltransferase [Gammaproteobacteria bacterium 50_400_T64]|nr:2-phospho-L-lactate guanylyltransferase [Gammaproteobacteria bacterium 50_400_T64]
MQVVVPVKSFKNAKNRLASVLTAGQRSDLMKHMLDDVLTAIAATAEVEGITVVTSDAGVVEWLGKITPRLKIPLRVFDPDASQPEFNQTGFNQQKPNSADIKISNDAKLAPINSKPEAGLCHAYSTAAADLLARGASTMLLLPADIPLVTKADIQALLAEHTYPGVSLAAAGSDGGTNALLVSPPTIIAPAFGDNSCQRHIAYAREQGLQPAVVNTPGLSLDIDTVKDIRALLAAGRECATLRYLRESGIAAELKKKAEDGYLQSTKRQQSGVQNQTNRQVG